MGTVKWTGIPLNSRYFPKPRWRLEEGFFSLPPYPLSPTQAIKIKLRPSKFTRGNQDYDFNFLPICFVTNSLCFPLRPIRVGVVNSVPF